MAKDRITIPSVIWAELIESLSDADQALATAETPEQKRIAALLALRAVYHFLKSVDLKSSALRNLSMALQDIDRGQAPALFQPVRQHRPNEPAKLFILKAVAAAAVQLLLDSGKSKEDAGAMVAKKLDVAGFRLSGTNPKPVNAATVNRWRDRFSGHSDEEGADAYHTALEEARSRFSTPEEQAEQAMYGLKRLVQNLEKPPS